MRILAYARERARFPVTVSPMPRIATLILGFTLGLSGSWLSGCTDDSGNYGGGVACCKYCKSGKPCGDSCISSGSTCQKSGGCACYGDAEEEESEPVADVGN